MTTTMPDVVAAYLQSTNQHDAAAFIACFAESAVVNDAGRTYCGLAEIKAWSDREIFAAQVTLDVQGVTGEGGDVTIRTKVDGNFDRTGLPDPVVVHHHITVEGDKIVRLTCCLVAD